MHLFRCAPAPQSNQLIVVTIFLSVNHSLVQMTDSSLFGEPGKIN